MTAPLNPKFGSDDERIQRLDIYIEGCRILQHELDHALDNLEFQVVEKGKIQYAVDFSEVYAYLMPQHSWERLRVFSFVPKNIAISLQRAVLSMLFTGKLGRLQLLEPYREEMRSSALLLRDPNIVDELADIGEAVIQVEDNAEIKAIVADLERDDLNEAQKKALIARLEAKIPTILRMLQHVPQDPLAEMQSLLRKDIFSSGEEFPTLPKPAPDTENSPEMRMEKERTEWLLRRRILSVRLAEERKLKRTLTDEELHDLEDRLRGASRLDARALTLVQWINKGYDDRQEKKRLILISRSNTMYELVQAELSAATIIWPRPQAYFVQSPRVLSFYHHLFTGAPPEEQIMTLESMRKEINKVLAAAGGDDKTRNEHVEEVLDLAEPVVRRLATDWEAAATWLASLGQPSTLTVEEAIVKLQVLIRQPEGLRGWIVSRLDHLLVELHDRNAFLAFLLQGESAGPVVRTSVQAMPYDLDCGSDNVNWRLVQFRKQQEISGVELLQFIRENFENLPDFKAWLVKAYLMGMLNRWDIAEGFCEKAIRCAKQGDPLHEAQFLLALCKRKVDFSPERFEQAYMLLAELTKEGFSGSEDTRYLVELGSQILWLDMYFRQYAEKGADRYSPQHGFAALARAEELSASVGKTFALIQIYNNRLDYLLETRSADRTDLEEHYNYLRQLLEKEYDASSSWPPAVVDTIVWARWNLFDVSEGDRENLARQLQEICSRPEIRDLEKDRVGKHLEAITSGKRDTFR